MSQRHSMTTQRHVRAEFWCLNGHLKKGPDSKRQNDYPADVRMAFVDFVDHLARSGEISEALAQRVTL